MLTVGEFQRRAYALSLGEGIKTRWTFRYWVDAGARDSDGISIDAGALSGSFASVDGMAATLALGANLVSTASLHKVDGSVQSTPAITDVRLHSSPASGDTYGLGEFVEAVVVYDRRVVVERGQRIGISPAGIDGRLPETARRARHQSSYTEICKAEGGRFGVWFAYRVQPSDSDANGISIAADA